MSAESDDHAGVVLLAAESLSTTGGHPMRLAIDMRWMVLAGGIEQVARAFRAVHRSLQ
jgi:hypothetical protein